MHSGASTTAAPAASDHDLMVRTRAGDRTALAVLYDRYHAQLYHFLRRWTLDPAAAEDLTHDVFLRLLDPALPYTRRERLDVWLFGIARNRAVDRFRRERYVTLTESDTPLADGDGPLEELIGDQAMERLETALARVSPAAREILLLKCRAGLDHHGLAAALGCTPGAARVRLHRALASLRACWHALEGRNDV